MVDHKITALLNLSNIENSLDSVRHSINDLRREAYNSGENIDNFIIPVEMIDEQRIYLVLNNKAGSDNNYGHNLYIRAVLNNVGTVIYDQGNNTDGYINYGTLPTVDFSAFGGISYHNNVVSSLGGNYEHSVRPTIIRLAMLVEAIRSYTVGDVLARAIRESHLEGRGVAVDFNNQSDIIKSWAATGNSYVSSVSQIQQYISYKRYAANITIDDDTDSIMPETVDDIPSKTTSITRNRSDKSDENNEESDHSTEALVAEDIVEAANMQTHSAGESEESTDDEDEELAIALSMSLYEELDTEVLDDESASEDEVEHATASSSSIALPSFSADTGAEHARTYSGSSIAIPSFSADTEFYSSSFSNTTRTLQPHSEIELTEDVGSIDSAVLPTRLFIALMGVYLGYNSMSVEASGCD